MAARIEDYGLIGDLQTAALVSRHGSIDWACFPRFDSGACFAKLLGDAENGQWSLAPIEEPRRVRRRYRGDTLVLETELETDGGSIRLIDFMPPRGEAPDIVRIVEGVEGRVAVRMDLTIRFDYGSIVPWVRRRADGIVAVAGPDALHLATPVELIGQNLHTVAAFEVGAGERVPFVLTWYPSNEDLPERVDAEEALAETEAFWNEWASVCTHQGTFEEPLRRSLATLKALTYAPTGGMVAAPTTSLPEALRGVRNWDYRFCWLRDATLTLLALVRAGYDGEAKAWRDWLLRAIAGGIPQGLQIMYGLAGERRLTELEVPWLAGYEASRPVRIGNAACNQLQLDVYGEVSDALYHARAAGLEPSPDGWALNVRLMDWLESGWREPDEGIWEVRGPRRDFTHSKVMAWVAFDRAVRSVEEFGLEGPVDRWRALRHEIHQDVCRHGFDAELGTFTQSYGAQRLDASLLMIPLVGFLPADDPRVVGTVAAVERDLMRDGFVERYRADGENVDVDGLPPGEGVFLPCSFWLVQVLALQGRLPEAQVLFDRLLALRNDLGLLSEEYDPATDRLVGNFPQAFTHLALVDAALTLDDGLCRRAGRPIGEETRPRGARRTERRR
jgi:GH15 family glucan-1,4-alpha-glucosidase